MEAKNLKVIGHLPQNLLEVTDGKSNFVIKPLRSNTEVQTTKAVQKLYPNVVKYLGDFTCKINGLAYGEIGVEVCVDNGESTRFMAIEKLLTVSTYLKTRQGQDYNRINTSIIRQLTCTLQVMQDELGFIHYDIGRGNNVLVRPTEDKTITYRIKDKDYVIPTEGIHTVIIDFETSELLGKDKLTDFLRMQDIASFIQEDSRFANFYELHGVEQYEDEETGEWSMLRYKIPFQPIDIEEYIENPKIYTIKFVSALSYPDFFSDNLSNSTTTGLSVPPLD